MKIVGCRSRLSARLRHGAAPTSTIVRNDAVTGCGERRYLMFPVLAAACIGMKEYDGSAAASSVLVPKPHAGEFSVCFACLRKGRSRHKNETHQEPESLHFAYLSF